MNNDRSNNSDDRYVNANLNKGTPNKHRKSNAQRLLRQITVSLRDETEDASYSSRKRTQPKRNSQDDGSYSTCTMTSNDSESRTNSTDVRMRELVSTPPRQQTNRLARELETLLKQTSKKELIESLNKQPSNRSMKSAEKQTKNASNRVVPVELDIIQKQISNRSLSRRPDRIRKSPSKKSLHKEIEKMVKLSSTRSLPAALDDIPKKSKRRSGQQHEQDDVESVISKPESIKSINSECIAQRRKSSLQEAHHKRSNSLISLDRSLDNPLLLKSTSLRSLMIDLKSEALENEKIKECIDSRTFTDVKKHDELLLTLLTA